MESNLSEIEQAFISQGKLIDEILDYKEKLLEDQSKTVKKSFSYETIKKVTTDSTFLARLDEADKEKDMHEREIELCDKLIEFCRSNPVSKTNAVVSRFLFNKGKFRCEFTVQWYSYAPISRKALIVIFKIILFLIPMAPISFYSILFSLLGGFAAIMPPFLFVFVMAVVYASYKSEREILVENKGYAKLMEKAYDQEIFVN